MIVVRMKLLKNIKMIGLEKGVNVVLVGKIFSLIVRIGIISEVIVILKVFVSYNILIKMSNVKFWFFIGVNGSILMRVKNSRKFKVNII